MIHYFVFDQFNPSSPTDYWKTEPGVEVPDWVCHIAEDEEFIPLFEGIKSPEWGDDDFIAVMKICSERACLFRVYPGGVDVIGRSNRWVILLAEGERKDFTGTDIWSAVDSGIFSDFKSLSREKHVEVPKNIVQRAWSQTSDTLQSLAAGTFEISSVEELREVSLALTSRDAFTGTILVQKNGKELGAKATINQRIPMKDDRGDFGETNGTYSASADNKAIFSNPNKAGRILYYSTLFVAFIFCISVPTRLWFNARKENNLLKGENDGLRQQISRYQGDSGRKIRILEGELNDLEKKNSYYEDENRRLKEKLQRYEFFITHAEKLEGHAVELRQKIDECTREFSETLSEIRERIGFEEGK